MFQAQNITDAEGGQPGWPGVLLDEWETSVGTQTALATNAGGFVQTHPPAATQMRLSWGRVILPYPVS